jgi:predicted  nucleic acid-binding Zn-ribbon protein
MTTIKQLYSLQELDLALDAVQGQKAQAEQGLSAGLALEQIEQALQEAKGKLQEVQQSHRMQQLEADSLRERSTQLEQQLYGGAITNPRELESLRLEAANVSQQLDRRDLGLLELSVQAEDLHKKITSLEKELADQQEAWQSRQTQLNAQLENLNAEEESLAAQRAKLAATVDQRELQKYESLRKGKGGRAVAKVERGLCQACRMSLPTQQLQRVRSGRQTVLCSSCGRMLFLG